MDRNISSTRIRPLVSLVACLCLAACQTEKVSPPAPASAGKSAALRGMEQVATAAYRCWFGSKDRAFRVYSFANELNSFSGQPRFLLVPKANYGGRPLLVVQAQGASGQVQSFGPMLEGPLAPRVNADIARWASGDTSCEARA